MPHVARKKSESGFYHVVTKGEGGQIIFEGDGDRARYLEQLRESVTEKTVNVHAFCLMSNHVHLLVEDRKDQLSSFMKRLNEGYARYFRGQTGRVGRVFKGRFWSEAVETDEYFLAALRYIHANPPTAGICPARDYPWSSYRAYLGEPSFVTTTFALELLGGVEAFERFSASGEKQARPFPGSKLRAHLSPDELAHVALAILGRDVINGIRGMGPEERARHVAKLYEAGFTERQIARVTGLGQVAAHRCKQPDVS